MHNCKQVCKQVEILDAMMGSGKTQSVFKWVNQNKHLEKFIYVSPLRSEVDVGGRIHDHINGCGEAGFYSPTTEEYDTKTDHLLTLLKSGSNIACTHSLYLLMTKEHFDEIERQGYIVIIDEELGVIENYDIYSESDLQSLIDLGCIAKQESDGMLLWVRDDTSFDNKCHAYHKFKRHVENGLIYSTKRKNSMMVTQLPIKLFSVAKRTIILTYMFEGNILSSFLKLKGIPYKPFVDVVVTERDRKEVSKLVNMYEITGKWKEVEDMKLSTTWYVANGKGNSTSKDIEMIQKFIETFARHTGAAYQSIMYTFPKYRKWTERNGLKKVIQPKGLIDRNGEKCWIAAQTRATNDYRHKTHVLHLFNRYPNQAVKVYLQEYGVKINDDVFALSEMLQWVWRSAIRDGNEITLCIASPRMKQLFEKWLLGK